MSHGGRRANAGRKPKALAEKLLEGNPGRRDIKVNKFKVESTAKHKKKREYPQYIDLAPEEYGGYIPQTEEIFTLISGFIKNSGCEHLIADFLVEDFAILRRAYLECEHMNKKTGRIVSQMRSPYVTMAIDYHKEMMAVYNQIWGIISKNSEVKYEDKNDFFELLKNRGF